MDDHAQNPTTPSTQPAAAVPPPQNQVVPPVVDQSPQQQQVQEGEVVQPEHPSVQQPVGSMNKEAGPVVVEQPLHEVMHPSEKAPEIPQEVAEIGVEATKNPEEVPDLVLHDTHKTGMTPAPVIAPVPTQPSDTVQLPDVAQARAEVKANNNPKQSKSWLVLELLKMAQRKLLGGHE